MQSRAIFNKNRPVCSDTQAGHPNPLPSLLSQSIHLADVKPATHGALHPPFGTTTYNGTINIMETTPFNMTYVTILPVVISNDMTPGLDLA